MSKVLCPMPHDEPSEAAPGLRLCRGCVRRLRRDIPQHPVLHDELGRRMANLGASNSGRVSGTKDPQINLDPRIVKARDNIVHDLHGWARIVMEERGLTGPDDDRPRVVAAWLERHVDWLAAQPFADEVVHDVLPGFHDARVEVDLGVFGARNPARTGRAKVRHASA